MLGGQSCLLPSLCCRPHTHTQSPDHVDLGPGTGSEVQNRPTRRLCWEKECSQSREQQDGEELRQQGVEYRAGVGASARGCNPAWRPWAKDQHKEIDKFTPSLPKRKRKKDQVQFRQSPTTRAKSRQCHTSQKQTETVQVSASGRWQHSMVQPHGGTPHSSEQALTNPSTRSPAKLRARQPETPWRESPRAGESRVWKSVCGCQGLRRRGEGSALG